MQKYIERFWNKVQVGTNDQCWNWTACKCNVGYGRFGVNGKMKLSHRVAYELTTGPIQPGMHCCHRCDNPSCCNPNHLFIGTQQENMDDKVTKDRQSRTKLPGILHGRCQLSEEQVIEIRSLYTTGNYTQDKLAKQFGVGQRQISYIVNRKQWSHI